MLHQATNHDTLQTSIYIYIQTDRSQLTFPILLTSIEKGCVVGKGGTSADSHAAVGDEDSTCVESDRKYVGNYCDEVSVALLRPFSFR